jgi:hypothetical protein
VRQQRGRTIASSQHAFDLWRFIGCSLCGRPCDCRLLTHSLAVAEPALNQVVAIGRDGEGIPLSSALDHVWGYAVGLDMTRRDLQNEVNTALVFDAFEAQFFCM